MSFAFANRLPKRFRRKAPARPETPAEAKARRLTAQRRKAPPSSLWWRGQMEKPAQEKP